MKNQRHYTFSMISLYKSCQKAYKYAYIDKIKGVITPALKKGTNVHNILEKINLNYDIPNSDEGNVVKNFFNTELGSEIKDILENKKTVREYKFGLDKDFSVSDYKTGLYRGIIDLIFIDNDGILNLCDYKTGSYKKDQDYLQLLSYATYFKDYLDNFLKIRYIYVEHNKENVKYVSKEDIKEVETYIKESIKDIENDTEFKKCPSWKCKYCQYKDHCSLDANIDFLQDKEL